VIARPQDWIDRSKARTAKIWFYDVEALYDTIPKICEKLGIDYEVKHITPHTYTKGNHNIFLGHHTYGKYKNMWHIKKGYVPGFMYWDKLGYSGWSEAVSRYNFDTPISGEEINHVKKFAVDYINNNKSKIKQPDNANVPKEKYVLVLGQRPHDTVAQHSFIDTIELSKLVNRAYKDTDIQVFTKPHPMSTTTKFYGKLVQGSMHKLISGAEAIYTVNSGSGFESLLHSKTVFTSGASDYSPATITVKSLDDIKNTMHERVDSYVIIHYLAYCFREHFVNCYDEKSIERKIKRCIDEYEI
jgi:hypothetical protein